MAVVTKEITRLLTEATEKRSVPSLNEAFRSLKQLVEQRVLVDNGKTMQASSDLYLFAFEAAVLLEQWDVAQHCCDRLVESTTTTRAFQIRTLFCRAALDVESTRSLRGRELVVCVQAALAKTVTGMKMALQDAAQLSHLVALGSRHIWNVGRSLFKDGTYGDVVATIGFTVVALEKIDFQDWHARITWLLRYATALAGASKLNDANATLQKASDLTSKYLPHMKLAVFRMQVAMSRLVANPKVKQDAAKGVLRAVYASNAVFCGLLEGAAAESELLGAFAELNADLAPSSPVDPSKPAKPAMPPVASPGKKEPEKLPADDTAVREEVFAELGLALALHGDIERASECAKAALRSRSLKSRVFGEYTSSLVKATACGGMAVQHEANANTLNPHMIAELAAAVRDIDRTIESAQRVPDASDRNHLVQYGCVLVWNIALPLLQPTTRGQIARSLQNTAKHLEDIQSNMLTLRTLLYYEAALTDVDSDYLNKATTKIEKALGLDYPPDAEDQRVYSLMKPLDRFLVWLKHKLDVRSNIYTKPDNVEDEALIIIEQAKGAPLVNRLSMLSRAVNMLQDSEPSQDYYLDNTLPVAKADDGKKDAKKGSAAPAKKGAKGADGDDDASANKLDPVMEAHRNHLRTRSTLWHMILSSAWVEKADMMLGITRQAAAALISRTWVRRGDRDMRQMQANAHFAVAESAVVELRRHDLFAAQRTFFAADASDDEDDEDHGADDAEAAESHRKSAVKSGKGSKSAKSGSGLPAFVGDEQALGKRVDELTTIVGACETTLLQSLVDGAKIGVDLVQQGYEDAWIVANAATLMWNFHTRAFAESRDFLSPLPGLEQLYQMILTVQLDPKKETSLIRDIAFSYCQGLVQQYVKDKLAADPANASLSQNALAIAASRANVATFTKVEANNSKLLKAAEVCDKMIAMMPTPMEAKGFLMQMASILRLLGKPLDQRSHPQQRLLMILEQLKQPLGVEEKRNLLNNTAVDLLMQDPNVELCARLAAASLALPDNDRVTVRIASIGAQLYNDGRLGWKQSDMAAAVNTTNAKGAKGGSAKAADAAAQLAAAATPPPTADPPPPPSPEDWHWYALLLQYQAIALAQLVNPVLQEKPTQLEIRNRALISLTNSAMAAVQGLGEYRGESIRKVLHFYRGMCQEFTGDALARSYVLPSLRQLLSDKIIRHATLSAVAPMPSIPSDMDILQDLYVLFLLCLRDAEEDEEGLMVLKTAMKCLPASHHRPFWGFDIQFRCAAGLPTSQTLLRVKEYAPEIQAQVWVVFSKYATSVEDQRFAMQSAVDVLGEKPVEQAAHMLLFAQWMLQTNYSVTLEVVVDLIMSAVDLVGSTIDTEAEEDIGTEMASSAGGGLSRNPSMSGKSFSSAVKTKTVGTRSVASLQGHAKKKSDRSRASIRALKVALEAYYILSRICGHTVSHGSAAGATFGTSLIGAKSALAMVVHYVMRIFATTIASANSHNHRQKAKMLKAQRVAAANGGSVTPASDVSTIPSDFDVPASAHGWIGFALSPQLVDTLKDMRTPSALSPSTIGNAESFIAVLEDVVAMLMREGMELQAHPVLQLMKVVIEVCLPPGQALTKSALNCANASMFAAATAAGVGSLAVVHRVVDPYVAPNDLLALREDARIALERKGTSGDDVDAAAAKHPQPIAAVSLKEPAPNHLLHKFWAALSRSMLLEGRITAAHALVSEAKYHAVAYGDHATAATCVWIEAQIEFLEGRVEHALELIRDCLDVHATHVCAHTWVDMKLFELDVLLAVGRLEEAMRTATIAAGILEQQAVFCSGLAKDIADHVTPELRSILLLRFSGMAVKALSTPSTRGHESIATLRQEVVSIVKRAMDSVVAVPAMKSQLYLLQVELSKLESETIPVEPSHRTLSKKKRLCQEARWLSRAIDAAKEQVSFALHLESTSVIALPTPMSQVGAMLCSLGYNLLDRVELNMQLLQALRGSDYTTLQYPRVEGAAQDIESNVVYFMRSTRKQRAADRRKEQRKGARRLIEERREIARSERQQEIDKRREQRKIEAEANQLAGKKDPKAKPAPKGGAVVVDEPDVDPTDKCGIASPDGSEDEGHGEDSQSDEEEELRLALRDLPAEDLETESRLNFSDVEACFLAAAEIGGEQSATNTEARLGLAVALMRSYEASTIGTEQREALLKGEQRPNTALSKSLAAKWLKPFEMPTDEDTAAKGKKKETDAKKPLPKGSKEAVSVAAPAATPVDPKQLAESNTIRAFTAQLEAVVVQATALSDIPLLRRALLAYGRALVLSGQHQAAALAVECAHSHCMSAYITDLWKAAAHPDATEVALANAVDFIDNHAPHLKVSPHYNEMIKAAGSASKMAIRIRPPAPSWGPSAQDVTPFSQDVCCFTATRTSDQTWLVVLRRPNGMADVRCVDLDMDNLAVIQQSITELESARTTLLTSDRPDQVLLVDNSNQIRTCTEQLFQVLDLLWQPFQPLIDVLGPKTHVAVCVDPELHTFPLEWCPALGKFISVQRELSAAVAVAKLQRRVADKYVGSAASLIVDPRRECPSSVAAILGPDEKPKIAGWQLVSAVVDENKQLRFPSVAQMQRVLTNTAVSSAVVDMCGRFTSLYGISALATLNLEHLRVMVLMDRGAKEVSYRRENQSDMQKTQRQLWAESSCNTALLLLARGVEFAAVNRSTAAPAANDFVCRTAMSNMEKPQVRSFTEVLMQTLRKSLQEEAARSDAAGTPLVPKLATDPMLQYADCVNVAFYGLSFDEPVKTGK